MHLPSSRAVRGALSAVLVLAIGFAVAGDLRKAGLPPYAPVGNEVTAGGLTVTAKVFTAAGWVVPGGEFPVVLQYQAGAEGAQAATLKLSLNSASEFVRATPAAAAGSGSVSDPLVFELAALEPGARGKLIVEARAKSLEQDPEIMWKDLSATVTVSAGGAAAMAATTHGPKVTTLASARYGDRPFPVVMVQYQDIKHCTGVDTPVPGCTAEHTAEGLHEAVNSRTSGKSLWQLYQDMSFGQLHPIGTVAPAPGAGTVPFDPGYTHKFSSLDPAGYCGGTTLAEAHATPAYANRIEDGWYLLPGTHAYYGSDAGVHAVIGQLAQQSLLAGIDDGCGPTGKIVYDAASVADPDIDYNDYDTDKDGVVDFFNLMFAGESSAQLPPPPTGLNNIWPHKSDLRYYFTDADGVSGYVSNDQLRNHYDQPMFYVDATRSAMTTEDTGLPVYVRVGPYNVNPENATEFVSVVAHEYGHSLGLPDFYSNAFSAMGSWELMGSDYFQYMTGYARHVLGWIVPRTLESGTVTLRESKFDTGEIHWTRPDGTPYVLSGPGIHNADLYRVDLETARVIDAVPSGTHAWHSGSGNDFGCPPNAGHKLDIFLPDMAQTVDAATVTLKFKSLYEIEWDYDYAFVQVSEDNGNTWTTLPSVNGTTIQNWNPQNSICYATHGNGITGVSGAGANTIVNPNRLQTLYPEATFIDDQFDLTAYKGKVIILRFAYATDPGDARRGWFIDDVEITADSRVVYKSDFETGAEETRLFPSGFSRLSTAEGLGTEHAYFVELRDRIVNDWDGKGQSERGTPGWFPGVSVIYSDRQHSFGNTGAAEHPGQTPVDAIPQPGNDAPNLNDAAFDLTSPRFDGCTHVDNYPDSSSADGNWHLPAGLAFEVIALDGLSAGGATPAGAATATLVADVSTECDGKILEPASGAVAPKDTARFGGSLGLALLAMLGMLAPVRRRAR